MGCDIKAWPLPVWLYRSGGQCKTVDRIIKLRLIVIFMTTLDKCTLLILSYLPWLVEKHMIKSSAVAGVVWKASGKLLWAKTGEIAGCLGSSQRSIQREWQHQTWLNVTATSCSRGHYFPTTIPWGQRAWSDSAQANLHYPLSLPLQVAHRHAGLIVTISGLRQYRAQQISVCLRGDPTRKDRAR